MIGVPLLGCKDDDMKKVVMEFKGHIRDTQRYGYIFFKEEKVEKKGYNKWGGTHISIFFNENSINNTSKIKKITIKGNIVILNWLGTKCATN